MAVLTYRKSLREYDVIIVGSGAGGGMMAMLLSLNGIKVLMLEAGRDYDPARETPMFNTPDQAPLRGMSTSERGFGFYDATVGGGWQVPGEPYATRKGPRRNSGGGDRACWAAGPTTGGGFPCVSGSMTSSRKLATGSATIGRFPM